MEEKIRQFCEQLVRLNGTMAHLFESGNIELIAEMNRAVKEIYRIQHGSGIPALAAVDGECGVIYGNFDMIVSVLRTTEDGVIDAGAQKAMNRLLHNIDGAVMRIAEAFGLIEGGEDGE